MMTGSNQTQQQKQALRQQMQQLREVLNAEQLTKAAQGLQTQLPALLDHLASLGLIPDRPIRLGTYAAIRHEADVGLATDDLARRYCEIYYPAVCRHWLKFARLPSGLNAQEFLCPGSYGIPEPPLLACSDPMPEMDVLLMPGLAFDRFGHRLGWGKAFYDRLLSSLDKWPILVGVCYSFQILDQVLPHEPTDQPVDWLLAPDFFLPAQDNGKSR